SEDNNDFLFLGSQAGAGLSNMSLTSVLRRMGHGDITVHGFRSTFMDWCHEQTNYPKVVIDMALAHAIPDKTEEAYRRGDLLRKREALAQSWSKYCTPPPTASGRVVPLRKGAPT